jgi:hypothetical protein
VKLPGHAQKNESQFKREEEEEEEEEDEFRSADITTDGFLVFINCRVERNRGRRKKKARAIYRMLLAANQEDDGDDVQ